MRQARKAAAAYNAKRTVPGVFSVRRFIRARAAGGQRFVGKAARIAAVSR
jgi:hypothetical protein